jgi:hypothetical protein
MSATGIDITQLSLKERIDLALAGKHQKKVY